LVVLGSYALDDIMVCTDVASTHYNVASPDVNHEYD